MKNLLKHQQIEAGVLQLVRSLPIGAKLPGERELAQMYGCNFLTVRRALKQVADDGWIVRRLGSGTFVARNEDSPKPDTGPVGMLMYKEGNAYAFRLLQAIAQAGDKEGIELRSGWIGDLSSDALAQAHQFQKEGCTALTLPWFPHERTEEVRALLRLSPLPISLALLIPGLERNCYIRPDLFEENTSGATDQLCRFYVALGERRIAYLGPDNSQDAVLQNSLAVYDRLAARERFSRVLGLVEPGPPAMDALAKRWKKYRGEIAIVSYDDEHALRFMTAMHKLGLSAPEDYRIIGFGDIEASRFSDPPLSTVAQDFDFIARGMLRSALALARQEVCQCNEPPRPSTILRSTGSVPVTFPISHFSSKPT